MTSLYLEVDLVRGLRADLHEDRSGARDAKFLRDAKNRFWDRACERRTRSCARLRESDARRKMSARSPPHARGGRSIELFTPGGAPRVSVARGRTSERGTRGTTTLV